MICGNAISEGEKFCSTECKAKFDVEQKKYDRNQKLSYVFIGGTGVVIVILFVISYLL